MGDELHRAFFQVREPKLAFFEEKIRVKGVLGTNPWGVKRGKVVKILFYCCWELYCRAVVCEFLFCLFDRL